MTWPAPVLLHCLPRILFLRSEDWTQAVRGSILNQLYLVLGGYADRGRNDCAAHVAANFCWLVDRSFSKFDSRSVDLLIVRTQQFEAKICGPGDSFCRYIVGNGVDRKGV